MPADLVHRGADHPHHAGGPPMHPDCQLPADWHAAQEADEQAWLDEYIRAYRATLAA